MATNYLGDELLNSSPSSSYPPSYNTDGWQEDVEKGAKNIEVNIRPIQFLRTRATTFGTVTGKEVGEKAGQVKRWITRSGTQRSENPNEDTLLKRTAVGRKFSGWRGGVLMAVVSAGSVLLVNICFTIWAAAKSKTGMEIGTIYEDDCDKIKTAGLWIHIAINIMGTLLLGSSNYTMQCLSSPTRKEADAAHSVGRYVDIGIPSPRNLHGWRKKSLFAVLVISTIPLHFLWNSAVFITTQQLDYQVYVVTPQFFNSPSVNCNQNVTITNSKVLNLFRSPGESIFQATPLSYTYNITSYGPGNSSTSYESSSSTNWYSLDTCSTANTLRDKAVGGTLERLSNEECVKMYGPGNTLLKKHANLLVVTKNQPLNLNSTILMDFRYEAFVSNYTGNNWVCDPTYLNTHDYKCNYKSVARSANEDWNLGEVRSDPENLFRLASGDRWAIDYCLSEPTELGGACQLQYSLIIMICVILSNMAKFGVIFYFLWSAHDPVLATIGDGIASYLERPDLITLGRPMLSRRGARHFRHTDRRSIRWPSPKIIRWWSAPSTCRWLLTLVCCTVAIIASLILLIQGCTNFNNNSATDKNAFGIGFGDYDENAVLTMSRLAPNSVTAADFSSNAILLTMVAIANIPQVIVSCLYFAYNTIYTSMVSADEWSRFTAQRKALRTTEPIGLQRSTYWLSLPWTYGLPLAAASSFLHWLISQSLFVARTAILNTEGETEPPSYMEIGYSPLAILFALLFGSFMVIGMVLNGSRKLKGGILVGNNSLAIAAACQRPENDYDAHMKEVKWGAIIGGDENGKGHCCFTSMEVEEPKVGELYI